MVFRVKPTPTRFPTNSLYTPMDKHILAFDIKCVPPVGQMLSSASYELQSSSWKHIAHNYNPIGQLPQWNGLY